MTATKRPATTIKKWVWRALFTSTMIPLLLVESVLVGVYFISNDQIRDANLNYLQSQSSSELNLAMLRESRSLNQQLERVQNLSRSMSEQARDIYLNDTLIVAPQEVARHGLSESGAWVSQQDGANQASGFYPVLPRQTQDIDLALRMTVFDPVMRSAASAHSEIVQSFVNLDNCYVRIFPYVDAASLLPPDFNCHDFTYFSNAAPDANPSRKTIWTDIYKDPVGQGWMTSAVTPFYDGERFLGVTGADMTLDVIINQVLAMELPWHGFAMLFDEKGRSLAVPRRGEMLLDLTAIGLPGAEGRHEEDVIRPAQLVLEDNEVFSALASQLLEQRRGSGMVTVKGQPYKVAWEHLASNDWIMLSLVDESAVFSRTAEIGRDFQLIGMALVGALILFYLSFFLLMSWRTHHISRRLSDPLAELRDRLHRIGLGAEVESAGDSGIVELDEANRAAEEMYQRLRQTQKDLQSSERRLLDSLEASGDSLWELDIPQRVVRIHPNLWKMLGASGHEPLVMREVDFDRLIHPDDLEAVHILRHRVMTTYGESLECQYRVRAPRDEDLAHIEDMGVNASHLSDDSDMLFDRQAGDTNKAASRETYSSPGSAQVAPSERGARGAGGKLDDAEDEEGRHWVLLSSRGRVVSWDEDGHPLKAAGMHICLDRYPRQSRDH